ncbi:MAG: hypothetical protein Ct9H300mP32_4960 [Verrucomicrobiota bacterium]|nr:MAG: hypothetical protein Ct9H300mP32_4960 [Verrucomicrobiota bacterium]
MPRCSTWPSRWTCGFPPLFPGKATAANVSSRSPRAVNYSVIGRRRRPICRATFGFPAAQPRGRLRGNPLPNLQRGAIQMRSTALVCRASTRRRSLARRDTRWRPVRSTARKSIGLPARFRLSRGSGHHHRCDALGRSRARPLYGKPVVENPQRFGGSDVLARVNFDPDHKGRFCAVRSPVT